ncbi:hypothetical protein KKF84_03430 [Myxococcota bacterium]|nr:hypothetical protein [Myxococcota bacterium]MBU1534343.1 hypothetical protein [Myxococcota bacterium]
MKHLLPVILLFFALGCAKKAPGVSMESEGAASVTIQFVAAGRGKISGNPCSKKGGLSPLVTFLKTQSPLNIVLMGAGNFAEPKRERISSQEKVKRAQQVLQAVQSFENVLFAPGSADKLSFPWVKETFPRVLIPAGIVGEPGYVFLNDQVFIASYDEGILATTVARVSHHQKIRAALRQKTPRLFVGLAYGSRHFVRAVASLPDAPAFLFWVDTAERANELFKEKDTVILATRGMFEEVLSLRVTFANEGTAFSPVPKKVDRKKEELVRLKKALSMASGEKKQALTRRLALLEMKGQAPRKTLPTLVTHSYEVKHLSLMELERDAVTDTALSVKPKTCPLTAK